MSPGWDEATFDRLVRELVEDTAPRLFALVEECGERDHGRVFAWGVQFDGRAALMTHSGQPMGTFQSAVSAQRRFSSLATMRLIWPAP